MIHIFFWHKALLSNVWCWSDFYCCSFKKYYWFAFRDVMALIPFLHLSASSHSFVSALPSCSILIVICPLCKSLSQEGVLSGGARLLQPFLALLATDSLHSPAIQLDKPLPVLVLFSNCPAVIYSKYSQSIQEFSSFYISRQIPSVSTHSEVDILADCWCILAFVEFLCHPI